MWTTYDVWETPYADQKIGLMPAWVSDSVTAVDPKVEAANILSNESGEPIVFYHGTTAQGEKDITENEFLGTGNYVGSNRGLDLVHFITHQKWW